MATKETTEVFLPINFEEYKANKVALLKTNLLTVQTLERIERLKQLQVLKYEQHILVKEMLKEIKRDYIKIKELLPKAKEVSFERKDQRKKVVISQKTEKYSNSKLDDELMRIKEKIKSLNL